MKVEPLLAALNQVRNDLGKDPTDPQWLAVHHAFCFISYKMGEFQKYVNDAEARGEFDAYKKSLED